MNNAVDYQKWIKDRIPQKERDQYLKSGEDFINESQIFKALGDYKNPDPKRIRDIIQKALAIETLSVEETAQLIFVEDPELISEMKEAALKIKKKVYDNRIVTFSPLYLATDCVNNCLYCALRRDNQQVQKGRLSIDQVKKEVEVLAGEIGHKRLIIVYGEHPSNDLDYMVDTMKAIYDIKVKTKNGHGSIRRVNVNAAPLSIDALKKLHHQGIGTYQVFQETYHHETYQKVHPKGTIKSDFNWRLYSMHRAFDAGIDDVGIGALFGLYDWKFEVLAMVMHAHELEGYSGIGPHTISFPRLEPALNTPFTQNSEYIMTDEWFKKAILVLRLAIPYAGMILTAREKQELRTELIPYGITQTDANSNIALGGYSSKKTDQQGDKQQFYLGDTRTLDEVIREYSEMGLITSFCTAGYRCGRTGKCIMDLLRTGKEGKFCKLNAVLTFREWLDDFASPETKKAGEVVIEKEIEEVKAAMPHVTKQFLQFYEKTKQGTRDLYF